MVAMLIKQGDEDQAGVNHGADRKIEPGDQNLEELPERDQAEHGELLHENMEVGRAVEVRLENSQKARHHDGGDRREGVEAESVVRVPARKQWRPGHGQPFEQSVIAHQLPTRSVVPSSRRSSSEAGTGS